eukprot:PhM_4_TR13161/c0_g1_i1/m.60019/K01792/E5.1.3.15; glucose-6-phosphate 1-epimerase
MSHSVQLVLGDGGLPHVALRHASGAAALLSLKGAHVVSWRTADGADCLYLSPQTIPRPDKATRGGIPLCWPQFSDMGPLKTAHGFARTSCEWTVAALDEASCTVTLRLTDTGASREVWPHKFSFDYVVSLSEQSLRTVVRVQNRGDVDMNFTTALHTYFRVKDITGVHVSGLGASYMDNLDGRKLKGAGADDAALSFAGEVDRIYVNTPNTIRIVDAAAGRAVEVTKSASLPDAVAWNPWVEKSKRLGDFPDDGYTSMVCVEAGAIVRPVSVPADCTWEATMVMTSSKL